MLDPKFTGRSSPTPATYARPGGEASSPTRTGSAPTPSADVQQGPQATLTTLRQLRNAWATALDGPNTPAPEEHESKPSTPPPAPAKSSGSDNGHISRLEVQGFASPEAGFEEPVDRGHASLAKTSNLSKEPTSTTQGGADARVTLKNTGRQPAEAQQPSLNRPVLQASLLRTVPIFHSMLSSKATPKPTSEGTRKSNEQESETPKKGAGGGGRSAPLPPSSNLRNSRGLQAPLSGSVGKRESPNLAAGWSSQSGEGKATLSNGRVVSGQVPIHSPILDLAQNFKLQAQKQGRAEVDLKLQLQQAQPKGQQLAEFALRHAGHSIESLLKKAYRLDSRQKLSRGEAVKFFALILKLGGDFTFSHSTRVLDLALDLADEMGVDPETRRDVADGCFLKDAGEMALLLDQAPSEKLDEVGQWLSGQDLQQAGILHDLGKTKIPPEILYKPGKLTDEEYELMKLHPILGEKMVFPIKSLRHLCPIIRGHHERWDGKGYPDGLRGERIPLGARIIAVADVFDALVAERPYKAGVPVEKVKAILQEGRGTHFDPDLSDAFGRVLQRRYPELGNPFE